MPPSGRGKGKTRARRGATSTNVSDAIQEPSDAGTPEAVATPTRSSRKRARGAAEAPQQPSRNVRRKVKDARSGADHDNVEGDAAQDASDDDTQPAIPTEPEIIASLKVAERQVNATEDFANDLLEGQENVPGYGKIAGRDWAFIIRKVEVNIGRPEAHERLTDADPGQVSASAKTVVDIDLGPDRQVSRSHAIISYDGDSTSWFIVVNGRNGLRVDNNLLRRGTKSYLRNGSVIEIAGTQMAFITSAAEHSEGPIWDGSIIRQAQKSSEEDDEEGEEEVGANGRNHPRRGQLQASRLPPPYNNDQNRTHPHSSRAAGMNTTFPLQPGTPIRTASTTNPYAIKSSPNASYARGINMESTESIDYSSNAAKDLKPPHSYAQLIGMAILSTPEQQMTLSNIYKWIMANYAFYRFNTGGWQNSIRHNLSLNKAFSKIARRTDEPGKGMKWMIEPTEFETFVSQGMKGCRRPPVQLSAQSQVSATQATIPEASSPLAIRNGLKTDMTPPLLPYAASGQARHEAQTPDHGPGRAAGLGIHDESAGVAAETLDFLRTTPRNGLTAAANAAGSPPALFVPEEGRIAAGLDTPFPLKPTQRLAPPSTLRRPSDFIQFSSPAPFWKMDGLVGNTPWKFEVSPLKTPFTSFMKIPKLEHEEEKIGDEKKEDRKLEDTAVMEQGEATDAMKAEGTRKQQSPIIPSSSPPRPTSDGFASAVGNGSPTATRPASRLAMSSQSSGGAKGLSLLAAASREAERDTAQQRSSSATQQARYSNSFTNGYANQQHYPSQPASSIDQGFDDGEDEGIDLAKGFQPIGAFHQKQRNSQFGAAPMGIPVGIAPGRGSFGR
ncbi:hypothetical protein AMS68_001040 [Peltaster fructicola]|uniref:Fork-head domain-containing protein n=1 Tax=Peltaster fructicola TaxID=286661 RepID=A0A6H0XLD2_9PEZI|nr:hypothetical protein AMS68_001040 [Peltaster fructicola]